jgi:hypothetical protein
MVESMMMMLCTIVLNPWTTLIHTQIWIARGNGLSHRFEIVLKFDFLIQISFGIGIEAFENDCQK